MGTVGANGSQLTIGNRLASTNCLGLSTEQHGCDQRQHDEQLRSLPTAPENITVTFLTPDSVRVSWQTSMDPRSLPVDKYDVTYKPTDASSSSSSSMRVGKASQLLPSTSTVLLLLLERAEVQPGLQQLDLYI
uniref:Fibronectin type-III domain-containing protein n=1 Tax=Anopheles albimanus TaxID=7167 RepID=A0A182FFU2_ANOAL